jgi:hypothetical protein
MSNAAHLRIAAWGKGTAAPATTPVVTTMTPAVTTWVHPDAAAMLITAYTVREKE